MVEGHVSHFSTIIWRHFIIFWRRGVTSQYPILKLCRHSLIMSHLAQQVNLHNYNYCEKYGTLGYDNSVTWYIYKIKWCSCL